MMVVMGGQERNYDTWQSILTRHGIKIIQKVPIPPAYMGLECELM